MDLKNLKNLNSPKYRIAMASVVLIGGGIVFIGMKNFGPTSGDDKSSSNRGDDRVRIDPSAISGAQGVRNTSIEDYQIDDNSEMARVYRQQRDDDREKALEGDGSFIFTLNPTEKEDDSSNDEIEDKRKPVKADKDETQAKNSQEKEKQDKENKMDAQEPPSFQEQLRNTRPQKEEQASPRVDPLAQQRRIYQQTNQQSGQMNGQLLGEILAKSEFKHDLRDDDIDGEIGSSILNKRNPELPQPVEKDEDDSIAEVSSRSQANSYARYIGAPQTKAESFTIKVNPGDIFYTRLQIGINTDEISPVRAEIIGGDLAGAVLLGYPKRSGEKAVIELDTMSFNGATYSIDAVALDMDTQRTGMADNVERHYGKNLFYLTLTSIISGYANSLQGWEETRSGGLDSETVRKKEKLDSFEDRLMVGIGEAGEETKEIFKKQINREPTVHVHPKDIAIMFMEEVNIGGSQ